MKKVCWYIIIFSLLLTVWDRLTAKTISIEKENAQKQSENFPKEIEKEVVSTEKNVKSKEFQYEENVKISKENILKIIKNILKSELKVKHVEWEKLKELSEGKEYEYIYPGPWEKNLSHVMCYIEDINKDKKMEILISASLGVDCEEYTRFFFVVTLLDEENHEKIGILSFDKERDFPVNRTPEVIKTQDIDGDNQKEIFIQSCSRVGIIDVNFQNKELNWLKIKKEDGSVANAIFLEDKESTRRESFEINDLNKNGKKEIMKFSFRLLQGKPEKKLVAWERIILIKIGEKDAYEWYKTEVYEWNGLLFSFNQQLSEETVKKLPCAEGTIAKEFQDEGEVRNIIYEDLEDDGIKEVIAHGYEKLVILRNSNGKWSKVWSMPLYLLADIHVTIDTKDLTGDKKKEIILEIWKSHLSIHHSGQDRFLFIISGSQPHKIIFKRASGVIEDRVRYYSYIKFKFIDLESDGIYEIIANIYELKGEEKLYEVKNFEEILKKLHPNELDRREVYRWNKEKFVLDKSLLRKRVDELFKEAESFQKNGEYKKALIKYQIIANEYSDINTKIPEFSLGLAETLIKMEQYEKTHTILKWLSSDPNAKDKAEKILLYLYKTCKLNKEAIEEKVIVSSFESIDQIQWSSRGDRILFLGEKDGEKNAWVCKIDGSELTRLDNTSFCSWLGEKVICINDENQHFKIFKTIDVQTNEVETLIKNDENDELINYIITGLIGAPDGKKFAIETYHSYAEVWGDAPSEVITMDISGNVEYLTEPFEEEDVVQTRGEEFKLISWIDNKRILVEKKDTADRIREMQHFQDQYWESVANVNNPIWEFPFPAIDKTSWITKINPYIPENLYIIEKENTYQRTTWTDIGKGLINSPLSPDGAMVIYITGDGLWLMNVNTKNKILFKEGNYKNPVWSPDGKKIAVAKDGNLYVLRWVHEDSHE